MEDDVAWREYSMFYGGVDHGQQTLVTRIVAYGTCWGQDRLDGYLRGPRLTQGCYRRPGLWPSSRFARRRGRTRRYAHPKNNYALARRTIGTGLSTPSPTCRKPVPLATSPATGYVSVFA